MRIAIFESSTGSGPHVAQLTRGLQSLGHHVEPYHRGQGYDLVIVHNQVSHRTDYEYPHFPDERIPLAFVDFAEFGWRTRLPTNRLQYANTFARCAMKHDTKNEHQQIRLKSFLDGRSFPYFLREMFSDIEYPVGYAPIDYPLYHLSQCDSQPNRENYLARQLDLFCSWGHSHDWRANIQEALAGAHVRSEISIVERKVMETGFYYADSGRWMCATPYLLPKIVLMDCPPPSFANGGDGFRVGHWYDDIGDVRHIEQPYYFARMQAAKCCPSFDGYGSGSFRMTEVLCRCLLLQGPLSIRTRAPLVDGETCRMYSVEHDGEEFISTNAAEVMREALADPEGSFEIYARGYQHCQEHLTEKATAAYLLDMVAAHDYSRVTALEVTQ